MEQMTHSHKVHICGENFQIKSDLSEGLIEKIAGYVDYKIKEVGTRAVQNDNLKIVVLAAMNIAGELFDAKQRLEEYERHSDDVESRARSLSRSLEVATQSAPE